MNRKSLMMTGGVAAVVGAGSWLASDGSVNASAFSLVSTLVGLITTGLGWFKDDPVIPPNDGGNTPTPPNPKSFIELVQAALADGKITPKEAIELISSITKIKLPDGGGDKKDDGVVSPVNGDFQKFKDILELAYQMESWKKNFDAEGRPVYYYSIGVFKSGNVSTFVIGEDPRTTPTPPTPAAG